MIKINYSYTILFAATVAGVGTAADSTPTAVLWRNGSASGVSVTVSTTAQTGLYKAVFTTDSGWAAADFLELYVTATLAGTAGYLAKVWSSTEIGVVELDPAVGAQITAIEVDSAASVGYLTTLVGRLTANAATAIQNLFHMITGTGASSKYTVAALENAPTTSGVDELLELQQEILDSINGYISGLTAVAVESPGSITGFPETLRVGDSYSDVLGRGIQIPIVDVNGNPISAVGSKNFADATATFIIKRDKDTEATRIITGSATFVDPPGTGTSAGETPYALIELPSSETAKGLVKYRYTGLLTFTWSYVGTGTDAEVMTFETGTITFEA